jgi:hypothetical protein
MSRRIKVILIASFLLVTLAIIGAVGTIWVVKKTHLASHKPQVELSPPAKSNQIPKDFSVTTITLKNGKDLQNKQPIHIPVAGVPLTITGTYTPQGSGQVWVVVEDMDGHYHLQSSAVQLGDNEEWTVSGVNTPVGTTTIEFVHVTSQSFQQMVQAKAFGAFDQLPDGSTILQTVVCLVGQ